MNTHIVHETLVYRIAQREQVRDQPLTALNRVTGPWGIEVVEVEIEDVRRV